MRISTLRATLYQSNPQVIREFEIEDQRTVRDMMVLVNILFGWDAEQGLTMERIRMPLFEHGEDADPTSEASKTKQKGTHFVPQEVLPISLEDTLEQIFVDDSGKRLVQDEAKRPAEQLRTHQGQAWKLVTQEISGRKIILELMNIREWDEGADGSFDVPRMIRFRRFHESNGARTLYNGFTMYEEDEETELEKYERRMDRGIRGYFAPETLPKEVLYELGYPLEPLLNSYKLSVLKDMIQNSDLETYLHQNKQAIVEDLAEEMNDPEFWQELLSEMSIREYKQLKEFCYSGKEPAVEVGEAVFPTMLRYCLLTRGERQAWNVPLEFLHFYQEWIERGREKDFLTERCFQSVVVGAIRLYGVLTKPQAEKVWKACYPDNWDASGFQKLWDKLPKGLNEDIARDTKSVLYNKREVNKKQIASLLAHASSDKIGYYIPGQEELESLAERGICFAKQQEEEIHTALSQLQADPWLIWHLSGELARGCHLGMATEELLDFVARNLNRKPTRAKLKPLETLINQYRSTVRMIGYLGYTESEYRFREMLQIKKSNTVRTQEKIYPNAPCPCGSGKKYKHCCGRGNA